MSAHCGFGGGASRRVIGEPCAIDERIVGTVDLQGMWKLFWTSQNHVSFGEERYEMIRRNQDVLTYFLDCEKCQLMRNMKNLHEYSHFPLLVKLSPCFGLATHPML
jgi:hypothetical protein